MGLDLVGASVLIKGENVCRQGSQRPPRPREGTETEQFLLLKALEGPRWHPGGSLLASGGPMDPDFSVVEVPYTGSMLLLQP